VFGSGILIFMQKIGGSLAILIVGCTIAVAILLNHAFDYWNTKISQRHPHYEKIHKYQEVINIYHKIIEENS